MILANNFWSIVCHVFMNRYYVGFLPFFRKTFTREAVPKENRQRFRSGRSAHFYHSYFIVFMKLIRIKWPYNLYNITWTNFKVDNLSSVTKLVFAGIALLLSIVVYCLLKYSLNKFAFSKKWEISWLPTKYSLTDITSSYNK